MFNTCYALKKACYSELQCLKRCFGNVLEDEGLYDIMFIHNSCFVESHPYNQSEVQSIYICIFLCNFLVTYFSSVNPIVNRCQLFLILYLDSLEIRRRFSCVIFVSRVYLYH